MFRPLVSSIAFSCLILLAAPPAALAGSMNWEQVGRDQLSVQDPQAELHNLEIIDVDRRRGATGRGELRICVAVDHI